MTTGQKQPTGQQAAQQAANTGASGGSSADVLKVLGSLNSQVDGGGKSSSKSLYGLGDWGSQTVNPGDLGLIVNLAQGATATTGDAIVQAFAHATLDQIATIQHALLMAGTYYPKDYTPKYGVVTQQDIAAFADAVKTAGQAGAPVADLLSQQAKAGAQLGIAAAQQQGQTSKVATVTLPNTQDLEAVAIKAFQSVLGHKATPQQAAQFAAMYRSMAAGVQRAQNQAQYDAENPQLPTALQQADPAALTAAATVSPEQQMIQQNPPNMNVLHPGGGRGAQLGLGAADTTAGSPLSFTDQVGGLMTLGQAVAAAQNHGLNPGLTQITQDSLPSADVAAQNYARNTNPKGAAATDTANVFSTFLGLLSRNFG